MIFASNTEGVYLCVLYLLILQIETPSIRNPIEFGFGIKIGLNPL